MRLNVNYFYRFLDRMDRDSACHIAIRIARYDEIVDSSTGVSHGPRDVSWVVDKDTMSWIDLYADLEVEIKHGATQKLVVTYGDKIVGQYKEIDSDSTLLAAFDMYWDIRRLILFVSVINRPITKAECSTLSSFYENVVNMCETADDVEECQQQLALCTQ